MTVTAYVRNLWGERMDDACRVRPEGTRPCFIDVKGLGILAIGEYKEGGWRAALFQPPSSTPKVREIKWAENDEDRCEVELLPSPSGEDRIVVVVEGLKREELQASLRDAFGARPFG